jgi:hypothetical protein
MAINPANFVHQINNPYFPLKPGTTFIYKSADGSEVVRTSVTHQTKQVLGVNCIVVQDRSFIDGKLEERTLDYFAQDKHGNVWYFGEAAKNFSSGHFLNTDGSWLAGINGAAPGIVMEAAPKLGDHYDQENAPGIAEDRAKIISNDSGAKVPFGSFDHVLVTAETTPLEPGALERKFYVKGVGLVLSVDLNTGGQEQLVKIKHSDPSTSSQDSFNFGDLRSVAKAEKPPHAADSARSAHHHLQAITGTDHGSTDHVMGLHVSQDSADAQSPAGPHGFGGLPDHGQFFDL